MFHSNTKIMIVDDMKAVRRLMTGTLKRLGYENVIQAEDGALAWQALTTEKPPVELIISDWSMPNGTGIDLLKRVRGSQLFNSLPFILVTAESQQEQIIEAIQAGVSEYVVKPFTPEILKEKLSKVHRKLAA